MSKVSSKPDPEVLEPERGPHGLIAYVHPGWQPRIRPASHQRAWMDATSESYAYRCLPLNIANAHGWELLLDGAFEAEWTGEPGLDAISFAFDDPGLRNKPVSLFGYGTFTIHVEAIMRTPPGWNLWVGGSPNSFKDGVAPLTGVIETDWSPYTFTMNWKFTRPGRVRFEKDEPYAFLFPVQRGVLETFDPRIIGLEANPDLMGQFKSWSESRDAFQKAVKELEATRKLTPSEKWQKRYYRGVDMTDRQAVSDHQSRLRLRPFAEQGEGRQEAVQPQPVAEPTVVELRPIAQPVQTRNDRPNLSGDGHLDPQAVMQRIAEPMMMGADRASLIRSIVDMGGTESFAERFLTEAAKHPFLQAGRALGLKLRKRDWLLRTELRHRQRGGRLTRIDRLGPISVEQFYKEYHALSLPAILAGLVAEWQSVMSWTPDLLLDRLSGLEVEVQGTRSNDPLFELRKEAHKTRMGFEQFLRLAQDPGAANEVYLTAYNSQANRPVIEALRQDMEPLPDILDASKPSASPQIWIGGANTFTPLHHDLTDNLLVQIVGRKRVVLIPPGEAGHLRNDVHVFSEISDIMAPEHAETLARVTHFDVMIGPGDALFIPIGWWHQVRSLDFSVSSTYTAFRDPCDYHETYP